MALPFPICRSLTQIGHLAGQRLESVCVGMRDGLAVALLAWPVCIPMAALGAGLWRIKRFF